MLTCVFSLFYDVQRIFSVLFDSRLHACYDLDDLDPLTSIFAYVDHLICDHAYLTHDAYVFLL